MTSESPSSLSDLVPHWSRGGATGAAPLTSLGAEQNMAGIVLDRISKLYIRAHISRWDMIPVIPSFFYIVHYENQGAAFSVLSDAPRFWRVFLLVGVSLLVMTVIGVMLVILGVVGLGLLAMMYWWRRSGPRDSWPRPGRRTAGVT